MDTDETQIEEAEANLFARCLLMPENFVRTEIRKIKAFDLCNDEHIKILAKKFHVSQGIMAFRLGELFGTPPPK
jgi:Zn-dependent peptidase ImmA (M78 family)